MSSGPSTATVTGAIALALIASAGAAQAADAGPHPDFTDNDFLGEQAVRDQFEPEDFSIKFGLGLPFAGGSVKPAILATDPVLGALTTGFNHAIYDLAACGVVHPHVHPRGDENVFAVSGTLAAGFVDEEGKLIRADAIAEGTAFVIPQGYMHYVANPTCEPAKALVTAPSSDGGNYGALPSLLAMPNNILQAFVPADDAKIEAQRAAVAAAGVVSIDPVCVARCAEEGAGSYGM